MPILTWLAEGAIMIAANTWVEVTDARGEQIQLGITAYWQEWKDGI